VTVSGNGFQITVTVKADSACGAKPPDLAAALEALEHAINSAAAATVTERVRVRAKSRGVSASPVLRSKAVSSGE